MGMFNSDSGDGSGLSGAPDSGTLGGTATDPNGENSATLGGEISPTQNDYNNGVNADPWGYDFDSAGLSDPGAMTLGSMFNYNSPSGLPTTSGENAGNIGNYGTNDFGQSPFFKGLRAVLGMTPVGKIANLGIGAAMGQSPLRGLAGMLPGMAGTVATAGVDAARSDNPAATFGNRALAWGGNMLGSTVGNGVAGPVGGLVGGQMVQAAMRNGIAPGESGGIPNGMNTGNTGFNLGNTLTGLAGLYQGHQSQQLAEQQQQNQQNTQTALQTQMGNLADMYSANSPYAQQLAQTLARKDAAAGRNSQYGPRAVALQAALAEKQAQAAQSMSSLANSSNSGYVNATAANKNANLMQSNQLARLLQLGQSTGALDWAQKGLSNLFNTQSPQQPDSTLEWA